VCLVLIKMKIEYKRRVETLGIAPSATVEQLKAALETKRASLASPNGGGRSAVGLRLLVARR
jgi:hypothetical protein